MDSITLTITPEPGSAPTLLNELLIAASEREGATISTGGGSFFVEVVPGTVQGVQ